MAKMTVTYEVEIKNMRYGSKPYYDQEREFERRMPGVFVYVSETSNLLAYGLSTLYKVVYENKWFSVDMDVATSFKDSVIDDGNGVKINFPLLTDVRIKPAFTGVSLTAPATSSQPQSSNFRYHNIGSLDNIKITPKAAGAFCTHEYVNVGFHLPSYACKHCGKSK